MLISTYATQPMGGAKYTDLFRRAFSQTSVQKIDIAVAYATLRGILSVRDAISETDNSAWERLQKRWVVGIDWRRSEPSALDYVARLRNSESRVFDGLSVVSRQGCVPSIPFHPKVFILHSNDSTAVISGSANLSMSGQTRGHEVGSLLLSNNSGGEHEGNAVSSLSEVSKWFDYVWGLSNPLLDILQLYRDQYETPANLQSPIPTEDDVAPFQGSGRKALSEKQRRQLRACRHLWIQAGTLHANRGPSRPGNQLMLSPMTRIFFGLPAEDVPKDTRVGYVRIEFDGNERGNCALRYSNNAMDVLGLPIPGTEGPLKYDGQTLLFEQVIDLAGAKYILRLGSAHDQRSWYTKSNRISGAFKMTSGRQWGVF